MNSEIAKTVLYYVTKSERMIYLKVKAKHLNIVTIQVHAPNESAEEAERLSSMRNKGKQSRGIRNQEINSL